MSALWFSDSSLVRLIECSDCVSSGGLAIRRSCGLGCVAIVSALWFSDSSLVRLIECSDCVRSGGLAIRRSCGLDSSCGLSSTATVSDLMVQRFVALVVYVV